MAENAAIKTVDHKIMSGKHCLDCGDELKLNKVIKGHKYCFVCFKLKEGKPYAYQYVFIGKVKTPVFDKTTGKPSIRRDFAAEQKANRVKNNWKR